jgi:hypothetical protein
METISDRPVCGCGKPWAEAAIRMGAQCINCGESSPRPEHQDPPPSRPTERELALEGALIDLIDLHHRTVAASKKHDPKAREFWDCDCGTCASTMRVIGDSPLFKTWQASAEAQRQHASRRTDHGG